jgi:hypothetical protein
MLRVAAKAGMDAALRIPDLEGARSTISMDRREAVRLMAGGTAASALPLPSDDGLSRPWTISIAAGVSLPAGRHQVSLIGKLAARCFKDVRVGPHLLYESDPDDFDSAPPGCSRLEASVQGPVVVRELRINQNGDLDVHTDRGVVRGSRLRT